MNYSDFCESLRDNFCNHTNIPEEQLIFYPDGWSGDGSFSDNEFIASTNHFYQKGDSDHLCGDYLVVQDGDGEFGRMCRFSMDYLYEEFLKDGWDRVWTIVDENLRFRSNCSIEELFSEGVKYNEVKSKLIIRPICFTDNRFELRNAYYRRNGDIALVLYAIVYYKGDMFTTIKVPKDFLGKWEVAGDYAFEQALLNTFVNRPPRIYFTNSECVDPPYDRGAFMAFGADYHIKNPSVVPTVTTYPNTNGAIAIFYPGVQEKLSEIMGGSYYVAFTSIHEARIHALGSMNPREILHRIKSVNKAFNASEVLTRKVYLYDSEKRQFDVKEL